MKRFRSKVSRKRPSRRLNKKLYKKRKAHSLRRFKTKIAQAVDKAVAVEYLQTVQVGQCSNNASGDYVYDATPVTVQGNGYGNRRGDEILVTGQVFKFQIWGQSGIAHQGRIRFILFGVRQPANNTGASTSVASVFHSAYLPNPNLLQTYAVNVYDFESQKDPRYYKNMFVPIREMVVTMPAPQYSGQIVTKTFEMKVKYRKPWRVSYSPVGTTAAACEFGQIVLAIVTDSGNCGGANNTLFTSAIPSPLNSTGYNLTMSQWSYFTDAIM